MTYTIVCVVRQGVASMYVLVCEVEETLVFPVVLTTKFFETGSLKLGSGATQLGS